MASGETTQRWIEIEGGSPLAGVVPVPGYKHAMVLVVAASLLAEEPVEITNAPALLETHVLVDIVRALGGQAHFAAGTLTVQARGLRAVPVPEHLTRLVHGSLYLVPPLLARGGSVVFGHAGGDRIGDRARGGRRPVAPMLSVLERFGASFEVDAQGFRGWCGRFRPADVDIMDYSDEPAVLSGPYVSGATKTAVLAAAAAEGRSVIRNPHDKDAVGDLCAFLARAGVGIAREEGRWVIEGGSGLRGILAHEVIPDQTEIMTWVAAAVHLGHPLTVAPFVTAPARRALRDELARLDDMSVPLRWGTQSVTAFPADPVRACDIEANVRGLSTDIQPFFTLMLLDADGPSRVTDLVWRDRFDYVRLLQQLGADLQRETSGVRIRPRRPWRGGQTLIAHDTRAAAIAVLAALGIRGRTLVGGIEHIERGYERFVEKLVSLGAAVGVLDGIATRP